MLNEHKHIYEQGNKTCFAASICVLIPGPPYYSATHDSHMSLGHGEMIVLDQGHYTYIVTKGSHMPLGPYGRISIKKKKGALTRWPSNGDKYTFIFVADFYKCLIGFCVHFFNALTFARDGENRQLQTCDISKSLSLSRKGCCYYIPILIAMFPPPPRTSAERIHGRGKGRHTSVHLTLLLCSHSPNDVPPPPNLSGTYP